MDHEFSIQSRKSGDVVVLDLMGSLTVGANEQNFKETVSELLAHKQNKMVVNLSGIQFMDSSGIGALIKSYTTLTQNGGKLKLLQPNKWILRTLSITGLTGVFEIFEEEAAAVASF